MFIRTNFFDTVQINNDNETDRFFIHNRKYLGAKFRIITFLKEVILSEVKDEITVFVDGFAGTGVVGHYFTSISHKVISNDILFSNYIVLRTFLNTHKKNASLKKVKTLIAELNQSEPFEGYVYANFGGSYFTCENAGLIDSIRERIESFYSEKRCSLQEKYILLTSLLYAVDKVANTVGQYDAFLKHIGKQSYSKSGTHRIDSNVYKRIQLKMPALNYHNNNKVYCKDLNELIAEIQGDVLYLDPPYNNRQYIDCYHVLENIMVWNKPELSGKTRKFEREHLKSKFSRKQEAITAFTDLIVQAKVKHIFLSYNNEGIIPDEIIHSVLEAKGQVQVREQQYSIFGNGAGRAVKRDIKERIFYCRVFNG